MILFGMQIHYCLPKEIRPGRMYDHTLNEIDRRTNAIKIVGNS